MKKLLFLLAFLIFNFSNSQNNIKNDEFRNWENPENFEKFGLKKVRSYSVKLSKKGRIKKDSLFLSEHNYDKSNSIISGILHYLMISMHGGSHLEFYNFKNDYTKDGLLLKKANTKTSKEKKNNKIVEFDTYVELYEYDSLKRRTKETTYDELNRISIFNKDTLSYSKSISYPKITEYEYDSKNRIVKQFFTRDSTVNFYKNQSQKELEKSKKCYSCEAKYLNQEWNYDGDNLSIQISYSYKKEVNSKIFYYYNSNNQLIKEIDSSVSYSSKPIVTSITEFYYNDKEKTEIKTRFDNFNAEFVDKEITKYDSKNKIKSINYESIYIETNHETKYEYLDNSTIITRENKTHKTTFKDIYQFDKRGLLIEKKTYYDEILTELIKYYYE